MKLNTWMIIAQILAELTAVGSMQPGDEQTLPPIHVKSGTTTVDITISLKQDPKR